MLAAMAIVFNSSPKLFAGASNKSGNPFGNGTFFSTAGTFNGVLRGNNMIGVTTFSTDTNTTISAGPLSIFNATTGTLDDTWYVYPILNPSANTLTAVLAGSTNTTYGVYTHPPGAGGSFEATLRTSPPNQVYNGNGVINLDGTTNQPFSISGVRIN